jgi:thiamine transport system substrate-binding protein
MRRILILLTLIFILTVSCAGDEGSAENVAPAGEPTELTLMSHDSFAIGEKVLEEFERTYGVKIVLLPAGDAGAALNQAILSKKNPLADLFFGIDNSFMSRALAEDIFEPYTSPNLEAVPDELKLDGTNRLTPVDYGDVCLNYDKGWFADHALEPPTSLFDLVQPEYKGVTVVENPATSSPGMAFLLVTIAAFGTEGDYTYLDFWRDLRHNDVLVTAGWQEAYFGHFSASGEGERPLVVSYATSPPAEVVFADPPVAESPTAAVTEPGTCFRQIEFVGILKGSPNQALAEKFIDFMLSKEFQEDIPLNMFVFPANREAVLPDVFTKWADVADEPAFVSPEDIEANRESWIEAWTEAVLR